MPLRSLSEAGIIRYSIGVGTMHMISYRTNSCTGLLVFCALHEIQLHVISRQPAQKVFSQPQVFELPLCL